MQPAPPQKRWLCYGDSIAEGWCASEPAGAWPHIVSRRHDLDVVNLGYAGSARGELPSAEELAALPADLISVAHGTNCWTRTPVSADLFGAGLRAFLDLVRAGHPETPIVAISPILRLDAEDTPNVLGMSLADLRAVFENVAEVAATFFAGDLDADHPVAGVADGVDGALDRVVKRRPTAAGVVLGSGEKQRRAAAFAGVGAVLEMMIKFAGERPFGAFPPEDVVCLLYTSPSPRDRG